MMLNSIAMKILQLVSYKIDDCVRLFSPNVIMLINYYAQQ